MYWQKLRKVLAEHQQILRTPAEVFGKNYFDLITILKLVLERMKNEEQNEKTLNGNSLGRFISFRLSS